VTFRTAQAGGRRGTRGPRAQGAGGFTLVEALAAIVVMVIVIPAVLQGFTIAGRIATLSRLRAEATAIGQSHLDEIIATQAWRNGGVSGGDERMGPNYYHWEPTFENWDSGEVNIQILKVTVSWTWKAGDQRHIELTTLAWTPGNTTSSSIAGGLP